MGPTADRGAGQAGSRAIERAMAVIDCFAEEPELSLSEVAARVGLPVSTTHRIMQALLRGGHLERTADLYRVGDRLAAVAPPPRVSAEEVIPHLYALAAGLKFTVSLGVVDHGKLITVVSARPTVKHCSHQIPASSEPLHATAMGKAALAYQAGGFRYAVERLGELEPYTARTKTSPEVLIAELGEVRRKGFAIADGERNEKVRSVAVPVLGADRLAVGALGVQAPFARLTDEVARSIVPPLRRMAVEVSRYGRIGSSEPSRI